MRQEDAQKLSDKELAEHLFPKKALAKIKEELAKNRLKPSVKLTDFRPFSSWTEISHFRDPVLLPYKRRIYDIPNAFLVLCSSA